MSSIFINMKQFGLLLADKIASFIGSWKFIIFQSIILTIWTIVNALGWVHFDPYPFILMNLFLSFQAAYATPLLLMSSNRQSEKDRAQVDKDIMLDEETNVMMKEMTVLLERINRDIQLDKQALKDHIELLKEVKELKDEIIKLKS